MRAKKSPAEAGLHRVWGDIRQRDFTPLDVPLELAPPVEPVAPGEVLLPDDAPGPQSFIADLPLPLALVPVWLVAEPVLALGLLVLGLVVPDIEPPPFAAALLPGPQSVLFDDSEPLVPELVPALVPDLPPVVVLVWAMAAVPRVKAMIEAAVRRRRCI